MMFNDFEFDAEETVVFVPDFIDEDGERVARTLIPGESPHDEPPQIIYATIDPFLIDLLVLALLDEASDSPVVNCHDEEFTMPHAVWLDVLIGVQIENGRILDARQSMLALYIYTKASNVEYNYIPFQP